MTLAGTRESGMGDRPPERTSHSMGSLGNRNPLTPTMDRCQRRLDSPASSTGSAPHPRSTAPTVSAGAGATSRPHSSGATSSRPMGNMGMNGHMAPKSGFSMGRPPMSSGGMNAGLSPSGGGYQPPYRSPQKEVNTPQA